MEDTFSMLQSLVCERRRFSLWFIDGFANVERLCKSTWTDMPVWRDAGMHATEFSSTQKSNVSQKYFEIA